jgi:hypothetical protein
MDINVKDHTQFVDGYMDAVGRYYTDDNVLVGINAQFLEENQTIESRLKCTIEATNKVENFTSDFEREISNLLGVSPRERMLFYLIEYVMWFEEYTNSCKVLKHQLNGQNVKAVSTTYTLHINGNNDIFIHMFKAIK